MKELKIRYDDIDLDIELKSVIFMPNQKKEYNRAKINEKFKNVINKELSKGEER